MENWDSISKSYQIQQRRIHTSYAQVATKMIDLIDELRLDERFRKVKVASAGMGMQLGIPGSRGGVYVEWHFDTKRFQVGVDYREPPYKVDFEGVEETEIITKIYEKLQMLKLNHGDDDSLTSPTDTA